MLHMRERERKKDIARDREREDIDKETTVSLCSAELVIWGSEREEGGTG